MIYFVKLLKEIIEVIQYEELKLIY